MRTERELLDDVFSADPAFQAELLQHTLHYAQRHKRRANVARTVVLALVLFCAGLFAFLPQPKTRTASEASVPVAVSADAARVLPGTSIRLLTDEELLEVFAGRAVAIIGAGDQKQFVVLDTFRQSSARTVN